ncbi:MAG: tRNA threonylcarbamoyladenosine dehydratase [Frankiales bacterium]|nr:tRNA threonylcarbamoyladenosine dehydratase [Frankiales bacterium]
MTTVSLDVSRNWGFITSAEQERLNSVKVAVAGAGGDGGLVAEHLARLGVQRFALADPESFEPENANRQNGCDVSTMGRNKAAVIGDIIQRINPAAEVEIYPRGIALDNIDEFVDGSALVVDETEYTQPQLALMIARAARPRKIPVVTGLNVGFGAMVTSFLPGHMTLEKYLGLPHDITIEEASSVDLPLRRWVARLPSYGEEHGLRLISTGTVPAPSVAPGVALTSGLVVTEAFNAITGRRQPITAPRMLFFDAMERRMRVVRMRRLAYYSSLVHLLVRSRLGLNPRMTAPTVPATSHD